MADYYTQLQIRKPYIALNTKICINIRQKELVTCKKIGYEFYCKDLFVVRYKSRYSCESAIYFDLDKEIIKQNCEFKFYYNRTDVTPTILDGGNEIILANWSDDKHTICTINNDIPIKIPNHLYVLVNMSVLCNCGVETENNFLLESLVMCHDANTSLIMYFTVNVAFVNYIDQFNLTEELTFPILTNKTTSEHTLLIFLTNTRFDDTLLLAPQTLKEYISQYKQRKEIFDLKERHDIDEIDIDSPNKNFFTTNFIVDIFVFTITIILTITTLIIIYVLHKHNKLRTLVASLAQVKEVSTSTTKQDTNNVCDYTSQFYIILALSISIIGFLFTILQVRRVKLCRGQLFSNVVKVMLFISDVKYYIPINLCKTTGSIHLFKIRGILMPDKVKLNKNYIWDILEVDWKEVKVTFNGKAINLPKSVTIKFQDKFKVRHIMENQPLIFYLMLKQGFYWLTLASKDSAVEYA